MQILTHRWEPLRKELRIPSDRAIGQSVLDAPAAIDSHIAVAEVGEAGVD